jgi:hypothetical protein
MRSSLANGGAAFATGSFPAEEVFLRSSFRDESPKLCNTTGTNLFALLYTISYQNVGSTRLLSWQKILIKCDTLTT